MDLFETAISQGIAPAIVVAIYLIVIKIIDTKKEKNAIKITNELLETISKISNFLDNVINNIIDKDKDKCKNAIKNSFESARMHITEYIVNVIAKNNINDNKDNIVDNIKTIINAEFYNTYNTLSMYTINEINVATILKEQWKNDLIDNTIKLFRESLNESMIDFNLDIIDGKEITLEQLLSSIETLPFMDERKIVIVKDFELLTKAKKKNFSDKEEKTLAEHLENIPDTTILVFTVYGEIDKRKSIVNRISKNGVVYNCEKISDMELFKWSKKKFTENNIMIENAQIMYFIESTGYKDKNNEFTLSDIDNEIKKISSFAGTDTQVTNEIIDRLSQKKIENDIFKLIDYIGDKNSQSAIKILNDMINEGESVLGIFAMINRQFKTVLQVKELLNKGLNNKSISEKLKTSLFIVNKSIKISKNFTEDMIIDMLNYILESDYKIKNGLMRDTLAIEMLVSKYCQRRVS